MRSPPVNVGDELDVKIEAVGEKGDGVAKKNGFVLFVPSVKEGDEVRIKVTRVLRKVGFAEVLGKAEGPVHVEEAPVKKEVQPKEAELDYSAENDSENFGEDSSDVFTDSDEEEK
ncbi:hypothetical protein COV13_00100 [Candidatus Woesearchaeota archaeon CG10_big_fil_rev_8_21_14_0_10_32_9]|nr:MAG: hypothetical protein COV13_00100 [Candidatus Woesearchaeota archaeon CG10_big_fil_rev_8_21_14_0_10_32_9]